MRRIVSAIAALLISITTANAQTSGIGPGTQTCNEFGRAYQQTQQLQQRGNVRGPNMIEEYYFSWAQGFFTGLNIVPIMTKYGKPRDLKSIPVDQQQQFLRDYCERIHKPATCQALLSFTINCLATEASG